MAGGPANWQSVAFDTTGRVFEMDYEGGTNARRQHGIGVEDSLGANAIAYLTFEAPQVLPSGTAKLRLELKADAVTGNAKINPKWFSYAPTENFDTMTLNAEGVNTVTWATGDNDDFKELKVTLDADTIVAGEKIFIALTFETASWTLAVRMLCLASIIWE